MIADFPLASASPQSHTYHAPVRSPVDRFFPHLGASLLAGWERKRDLVCLLTPPHWL